MLKNFFAAALFAVGLALAPVILAVAPAAAQGTASVVDMQAEIEALILQYGEDEAALELEIEAYVTGSANPELATQAVINALTNPTNPEVRRLLAENAGIKLAVGRGLGAAIAVIALTNPGLAATLLAMVEASGDATLIAAVAEGQELRTAAILRGSGDTGEGVLEGEDSTPEAPASAN